MMTFLDMSNFIGKNVDFIDFAKNAKLKDKNSPSITFDVKAQEDTVATYQVNLTVTDEYKGEAKDSVIINVHHKKNQNPKAIIEKEEAPEITETNEDGAID